MQRSKAFTLIELLVVIAIIAILAAILFPVFAQAKVAAKGAASISNMKQQALAQQMYASDYDDTLVWGWWDFTTPAGNATHWVQRVLPYIKNDEIFVDPSGPAVYPTEMEPDVAAGATGGNIAINWHVGGGANTSNLERIAEFLMIGPTGVNTWGDSLTPTGEVTRAATTMNPWHHEMPGLPGGYPDWASMRCQQAYDALIDPYVTNRGQAAWAITWRYNEGANFAFGDGHAESIKKNAITPEQALPSEIPDFALEPKEDCSTL